MHIRSAPGRSATGPVFGGLMADMARFGARFAPDDGTGGGGDEGGEVPPKPSPKPKKASDPTPAGPSERELALAAELDALKARLQGFGDLSPDQVKELRAAAEEAARLKREAEEARKKAEEEELRKRGDFDALRQRMAEEHQREMEGARGQVVELDSTVKSLKAHIEALTLGTAFGSSRFLTEETVLTPEMARKVFGEHFEIEGGVVVGYSAPRGAERRVKIVDAKGQPKPFEEAIREIVGADPARERILRSAQKPGTGVVPKSTRAPEERGPEPRGVERLRMIVPRIMGGGK